MSDCYAVLLDTVSIQAYIFQSNQLKEHIGASYLIEKKVYRDYAQQALEDALGQTIDMKAWETDNADVKECSKACEIGYIGGGNALLLFQRNDDARKFLKIWTKKLLRETPGLTTAATLDAFSLDDFAESKKRLFHKLRCNRYRYVPITMIPGHGITADCRHNGEPLVDEWQKQEGSYVSSGTSAKISAAKGAQVDIHSTYEDILRDESSQKMYCFTDQLDLLGQMHAEDSHIAIVHIDGNDIGVRFHNEVEINSLQKARKLSVDVDTVTKNAFKTLLKNIVREYKSMMQSLGFNPDSANENLWYPVDQIKVAKDSWQALKEQGISDKIVTTLQTQNFPETQNSKQFKKTLSTLFPKGLNPKEKRAIFEVVNKKYILPIRPIILGGDDVTFVCDGRLGIYFAEQFINAFEGEGKQQGLNEPRLTACAGVAIVKSKYPFSRGYSLAEELCSSAKRTRKENIENGDEDQKSPYSYIDFHLFSGGPGGSLKEIREKHFTTIRGDLLYRPYKIAPQDEPKSFAMMIEKTRELLRILPTNKRYELRQVLTLEEEAGQRFLDKLTFRERNALPSIPGESYHTTLFHEKKTPYFDMIELMQLYPGFKLQEEERP